MRYFTSMRQIWWLFPRFVVFWGLCRIVVDKNRSLFAELSIKLLFVYTTASEITTNNWNDANKTHIFALTKVKNNNMYHNLK